MTFFNIFSKTREREEEATITVKIDNREKNALVASELSKLGCKILFEQLEVGDYIVGETAIERKTIKDLKSSIIDKRLMNQIAQLKQHKEYALIVEGPNTSLYEGKIHENALRGFIVSLVMHHHIPLIYTFNEEDTAKCIALLGKRRNKSLTSLRPGRIAKTDEEKMQFILEGFPAIGPASAQKLLREFKTIKKIINAEERELERCIKKKARELTRIVEKEYSVQNSN